MHVWDLPVDRHRLQEKTDSEGSTPRHRLGKSRHERCGKIKMKSKGGRNRLQLLHGNIQQSKRTEQGLQKNPQGNRVTQG